MRLSENLQEDEQLSQLVKSTEDLLQQEVGPSLSVSWDLAADSKGRPLLVLRLQDSFQGECSASIAPEELSRLDPLQRRFYDLKGALVRVGEWRSQLQQFFQTVRSWCRTSAPDLEFVERSKTVQEERSGEYQVPLLEVFARTGRMELRPIATWVVGADGRLDLVGPEQEHTLLFSKREGWLWVDARDVVTLRPLNQDLMVRLIRDSRSCLEVVSRHTRLSARNETRPPARNPRSRQPEAPVVRATSFRDNG
jgi:hypothetical protein